MKAKLVRSYKSSKGNVVFVYGVTGKPEELAKFAEAQGPFHRTDETTGEPLWFTTRCVGQVADLIITSNNKVVADMSAFDQAASLAAQYGGNLGDQLARAAADALLGKSNTSVSSSVPATPSEAPAEPSASDPAEL